MERVGWTSEADEELRRAAESGLSAQQIEIQGRTYKSIPCSAFAHASQRRRRATRCGSASSATDPSVPSMSATGSVSRASKRTKGYLFTFVLRNNGFIR